MDLKQILKKIKLQEGNISTILGFVVIVLVGLIVVNYFRDSNPGETIPGSNITQEEQNSLPTTHKVAAGESLWSISEKYYDSGYNWVDIQKENNLANPGDITVGQELVIPNVDSKKPASALAEAKTEATEAVAPTVMPSATPEATPSTIASATPTVAPTATSQAVQAKKDDESKVGTSNDTTYTVVHGDNLWDIAVKEYGDGYKWTDIAKANKLVNPSIIHAGNHLSIPR